MATTSASTAFRTEPVIELRNPFVAALLAWLWPGAGHLYQRRTGKGLLYMVCILGTYLFGLYLGDGKVVYYSWRPNDTRWAYFCQVGIGLPALPALIQADRAKNGQAPLFNLDFMTPPQSADEWKKNALIDERSAAELGDAGPKMEKYESPDELGWWSKYLGRYFELGTVYTMIAGLLNILAIYDAYAGPVPVEVLEEDDDQDKA